jgi:hypothetical protein
MSIRKSGLRLIDRRRRRACHQRIAANTGVVDGRLVDRTYTFDRVDFGWQCHQCSPLATLSA